MSEITRTVAEIRERHEAVTGYFADFRGTDAHRDRGTLLTAVELLTERIAELEAWQKAACEEMTGAQLNAVFKVVNDD